MWSEEDDTVMFIKMFTNIDFLLEGLVFLKE